MSTLNALLESAFKLSCTQSLPAAPSIQNAIVDGQWHTVISPCNGYGMLTTPAGNPGNLEIAYNNIGFDAKCANSSTGVAAFVPIKKGGSLNYRITNSQGSPTVQIRFFPFVGTI